MGRPTKDQIRERDALAQFGLKRCGKCRGVKPRVNFGRNKGRWDGLQYECKDCWSRYARDNREARLKYHRQYYQDNREALVEYRRRYVEENPDCMREYRQTPKGKDATSRARRKSDRKRRALKAAVNESFTAEDEAFVFERDGHRCLDCGITNQEHIAQFGQRLHIDHVLPLSKGHALTRENAALRCRSCNSSKGNRT